MKAIEAAFEKLTPPESGGVTFYKGRVSDLVMVFEAMGETLDTTCNACLGDAQERLNKMTKAEVLQKIETMAKRKSKTTLRLKAGIAFRFRGVIYTRETCSQEVAEAWIKHNAQNRVHFDEVEVKEPKAKSNGKIDSE